MKVLSAETNLSSATNISSASIVRIFNSDSSVATVTKKDSGGSTIGTFTVGAGKVIYCEKNYTDTLEGGSGLKVSKVGYSHMMSYASYSSSGGGGGSSIITTNLVLHLDASNSSSYSGSGTTWTDLSGSGNNGTLVNGVTYNSGEGGYLIFDGTNDTVTLPAGSDFAYGTGDFTIEMWYNVTGTTLQNYGEVLFAQSANGVNYFVLSSSHGLTPVKKALFKGIASTTEYVEGAWNHLLVTRNGTTVTLYFNASAEGTGTVTQDFNNTTYVPTIGNYTQNTNAHFDGKIAQLRIYKGKGFSASEVLQNYNATKSNYILPEGLITTNLVLHLDASNSSSYSGSGTSWNDISGNGNNLTLTNGPTYTSSDGGAIVFDGTNDCAVSALNQSFFQFGTDDYSYGLWVKFDTLGDYEGSLSSGRGNDFGTNDYVGSWQIDTVSGAVNHKLGPPSGTNITLTSSLSPSTGTWYYIFVVNDRSENELKLYVNGSLNTTSSNSGYGSVSVGNYSNTTSIYNIFNVGRNRNQDSFLDGSVAQVHVYKGKALTAAEVLHNYNSTKSNYV